jgi:hypothetical protein
MFKALRAGQLDDWVSIPGRGWDFLLRHHVHTGSGAHPAFCPMATGGSFCGSKAAGAWSWPLTFVYFRSRMRGAIPPLPQYIFMAWCLVKHRHSFTFTFAVSMNSSVSDATSYATTCRPTLGQSQPPKILNLGTRFQTEVSFTLRPLSSWRKSVLYSLCRRVGGPHRHFGRYGNKKIPCPIRQYN